VSASDIVGFLSVVASAALIAAAHLVDAGRVILSHRATAGVARTG
jgi:hypothetical protein